jgi:DNA modification methylase
MSQAQTVTEVKGYIFACTNKTEKECFDRMLFSTNKIYAEKALQVKKGDMLFLLNLETDVLYGPFKAESDGKKDIVPEAWGGKYPYQVVVEKSDKTAVCKTSGKILNRLGVDWKEPLNSELTDILVELLKNGHDNGGSPLNLQFIVPKKIRNLQKPADEKPTLEATTLWDYPRQSYGKTPKGNNRYAGVTPAFILYNMIKRYTEPGDLVVDPMSGSGTTLDVCREENRRCIAYDIAPPRLDIIQNDARHIPLDDNSVDMIFIDSPYGDNIDYNSHPGNIGKISAESDEFYDELEKVMKECHRILKQGKVLGWLIGDQWVKKKFTPVGFLIYQRLCKYFETVDIVCVTRRNQTSNTGMWYNRAIRFNFYLRGFKYLFLMRKDSDKKEGSDRTKVNWTQYSREKDSEKAHASSKKNEAQE